MSSFCLTFDIDWAPEEVIDDLISLLDSYDLPATLFCTHKSSVIDRLDRKQYELSIHPNFRNTFDYESKIIELLELYPEAKGIRSHGLLSSTNILLTSKRVGLAYEANTFLPSYRGLYCVERFPGFTTIPYNYSDSGSIIVGNKRIFEESELLSEGLKVFTFHPIHVFLNTYDSNHYADAKKYYQDVKQLRKMKNNNIGVRNRFLNLLDFIKSNRIEPSTCKSLVKSSEYAD